jgi:copper(I)-binding protein
MTLGRFAAGVFSGVMGLALWAGTAAAEDIKAGDLQIGAAWARATPSGAKVGAGYLTITNNGQAADKLVGVSSDAAGKVEVHEMAMKNGVMTMRPAAVLAVDPGKSVALKPGGYHLMFTGLKAPFKQGGKVAVTLQFEKAGSVPVTLDVQGVGAQAPAQPMQMTH